MRFFPPDVVGVIQDCAHWADRLIRADLIEGLIAGENDYTSNFTGALRREVNARKIRGLTAKSFVLKPTVERAVGADACIILANPTQFKICLFEAKWPRLQTRQDCWDSVQVSTGESHFHGQIKRQAMVARTFAIWEMFYCEYPFGEQPSYMPNEGSACIWHDDALAATIARSNSKVPWTDPELHSLLARGPIAISEVIGDVCTCRKGQLFSGSDFEKPFIDYGVPSHALVIRYAGTSQDVHQGSA